MLRQVLIGEIVELRTDVERLETDLNHENETYAANGGVTLEVWKDLQNALKDEEDRRERINWNLKSAATEILSPLCETV